MHKKNPQYNFYIHVNYERKRNMCTSEYKFEHEYANNSQNCLF